MFYFLIHQVPLLLSKIANIKNTLWGNLIPTGFFDVCTFKTITKESKFLPPHGVLWGELEI